MDCCNHPHRLKSDRAMVAYKTRVPPYLLLLVVLAFALVSFVGFEKMRDMRFANDLIRKKEAEIESLQEDLQREREASDQLRDKLEDLRKRTDILRSEKVTLSRQLNEMEIVKNAIEEGQKRLQSFLQNKEDQIIQLKEQERKATEQKNEVQTLTETLDKKEHEINDMKAQIAVFEEGAGKLQNNTIEKMEAHKNDAGTSQLVNTTGNANSEENFAKAATKDKSDSSREENTEEDFFEGRAMENIEKSALGDKVGTTTDGGGLHDRQFEESSRLQDRNTRDEEEDVKENLEEETEGGNDNLDDIKELDDLEDNTDDKDPEDEQGEENVKVDDEEETDI